MGGRVKVQASGLANGRIKESVTFLSGYPHLALIDKGGFEMVEFQFWACMAPLFSVSFCTYTLDDRIVSRGLRRGKSRGVYQDLRWTEFKNWCIIPV